LFKHDLGDGGDMLANLSVSLDYGYGESASFGRLLGHPDNATLQTLSVEVGGRVVTLSKRVEGNGSQMRLCFSDVGNGEFR